MLEKQKTLGYRNLFQNSGGAVAVEQAAESRMNNVFGMLKYKNMPPNMPPKKIS